MVKNEVRLFLKISWSRAGCKKPHHKILILAEVMIFLNLAHNTITIRKQTSNCSISKRRKEHFLRKQCMVEVPNEFKPMEVRDF